MKTVHEASREARRHHFERLHRAVDLAPVRSRRARGARRDHRGALRTRRRARASQQPRGRLKQALARAAARWSQRDSTQAVGLGGGYHERVPVAPPRPAALGLAAALLAAAGCGEVLGLDGYASTLTGSGGASTSVTASAAGGGGATATVSGSVTSSSAGAGGSGGAGGTSGTGGGFQSEAGIFPRRH